MNSFYGREPILYLNVSLKYPSFKQLKRIYQSGKIFIPVISHNSKCPDSTTAHTKRVEKETTKTSCPE